MNGSLAPGLVLALGSRDPFESFVNTGQTVGRGAGRKRPSGNLNEVLILPIAAGQNPAGPRPIAEKTSGFVVGIRAISVLEGGLRVVGRVETSYLSPIC